MTYRFDQIFLWLLKPISSFCSDNTSKSISQSGTMASIRINPLINKRALLGAVESKTWPAICSGGVIDIAHEEVLQRTCYRSVRLSESSRNVLPMCYPSAFLFSWLLHHGLRIIAQPLHHTKCRAHLHFRT